MLRTTRARLTLGLIGLIPCLACFSPTEGDRTSSGACPPGETCFAASECPSGSTCSREVSGLFFTGSLDIGDGTRHVGTVAVGGTERIVISSGALLETATQYRDPVRVESDAPEILSVESSAGGVILVRGESEGEAVLRVLEPTTGLLLDRITVFVGAVSEVRLRSSLPLADPEAAVAILAGARVRLSIGIDDRDADEGRYSFDESVVTVDHGMSVRDELGRALITGADGAPYSFEVHPTSAGTLRFFTHFAGLDVESTIAVVDDIDGIILQAPDVIDLRAARDRDPSICAYPAAAAAIVLGGPEPTFTVSGAEQQPTFGNCTQVTPTAPGEIQVVVTLGGLTRTHVITVRDPAP